MDLAPTRRRRPKQQRSRLMVDFILEAASQVFDEEGYNGATTNMIAERAGISIGSLYQYFPNKGALILELRFAHRAHVLKTVETAMATSEHLSLPDAIRKIVDANFQVHLNAPRLNAAFEEQTPAQTLSEDPDGFHRKIDRLRPHSWKSEKRNQRARSEDRRICHPQPHSSCAARRNQRWSGRSGSGPCEDPSGRQHHGLFTP
jgi:AcrR family transcriptional regulator